MSPLMRYRFYCIAQLTIGRALSINRQLFYISGTGKRPIGLGTCGDVHLPVIGREPVG